MAQKIVDFFAARANGLLASSQELKVVEIGGLKVLNLIFSNF